MFVQGLWRQTVSETTLWYLVWGGVEGGRWSDYDMGGIVSTAKTLFGLVARLFCLSWGWFMWDSVLSLSSPHTPLPPYPTPIVCACCFQFTFVSCKLDWTFGQTLDGQQQTLISSFDRPPVLCCAFLAPLPSSCINLLFNIQPMQGGFQWMDPPLLPACHQHVPSILPFCGSHFHWWWCRSVVFSGYRPASVLCCWRGCGQTHTLQLSGHLPAPRCAHGREGVPAPAPRMPAMLPVSTIYNGEKKNFWFRY